MRRSGSTLLFDEMAEDCSCQLDTTCLGTLWAFVAKIEKRMRIDIIRKEGVKEETVQLQKEGAEECACMS